MELTQHTSRVSSYTKCCFGARQKTFNILYMDLIDRMTNKNENTYLRRQYRFHHLHHRPHRRRGILRFCQLCPQLYYLMGDVMVNMFSLQTSPIQANRMQPYRQFDHYQLVRH